MKASNVGVGIVLASVLLFGCNTVPASEAQLNGEALFKGIMFGEGPAGRKLSVVWQRGISETTDNQAIKAKILQGEQDTINWIAAKKPQFFVGFGKAMVSGDHLKVESALQEVGELLESYGQANRPLVVMDEGGDGCEDDCGGEDEARLRKGNDKYIWKDKESIAIIEKYVVITEAVTNIDFFGGTYSSPFDYSNMVWIQSKGGSRTLKSDLMVDAIATALRE